MLLPEFGDLNAKLNTQKSLKTANLSGEKHQYSKWLKILFLNEEKLT